MSMASETSASARPVSPPPHGFSRGWLGSKEQHGGAGARESHRGHGTRRPRSDDGDAHVPATSYQLLATGYQLN